MLLLRRLYELRYLINQGELSINHFAGHHFFVSYEGAEDGALPYGASLLTSGTPPLVRCLANI